MKLARTLLLVLLPLAPALAQDQAYPKGSTSQRFAELKFQLVVPAQLDAENGNPLIVVLHGAGGTETGMAGSLQPLAKDGFVICAPKSTTQVWDKKDVERVKEIVRHLQDVMKIGKLHSMGFSNGGWNLAPLAFDEKLHFASACWVAAGYNGGKVPRWAKKEMGCMALAGAQDGNRGAAEKTVDLLEDKVRSVEVRLQPNLGHAFPRELFPYYCYWVKVMDGRYVPGEDLSFEWTADPDAARAEMTRGKKGGFFYFWSKTDAEREDARAVQNEVFFHPLVRRFGSQLVAVKMEREQHEELFASLKLKETPAVAVLKRDGKLSKSFAGTIKPTSLAKALRKWAKDKSVPR